MTNQWMPSSPLQAVTHSKPVLSLINCVDQVENFMPEAVSVAQACRIIDSYVQPIQSIVNATFETCPIFSSSTSPHCSPLNRVLAETIISPINVPAHDNAAMDGYAFRSEQLAQQTNNAQLTCRVVGIALAGHAYEHNIHVGECVKIMTGAPMPPNCDTVVPYELCDIIKEKDEQEVHFANSAVSAFQHRRLKGEDVAQGSVAILQGKVITPADIGLLASLGMSQVPVYRQLKVAFFSSGDELLSAEENVREGGVYDSNRATLLSMLTALNCEAIDLGIIQDHPDALKAVFQHACVNLHADVIISSGGISDGVADHTKQVLSALGECAFWHLAMRPGRPFVLGQIGQNGQIGQISQISHEKSNTYVFGLPGNPVAMMVSFYVLVKDALLKMMGAQQSPSLQCSAISRNVIKKRVGRTEYLRGVASMSCDGQLEFTLTGAQGSGILRSMSAANCFAVLPESQTDVGIGDAVSLILFHGLI